MNLKQVDLNLLVALDVLLKERNVTRAGKRMGLSQPAMSAALGRLRDMFGDPLLERVGREYLLTPFAQELSGPVQEILVSIERALERNAPFDPATLQRDIRIACTDYVTCVLAHALIARISERAPRVRIHFQQLDARISRHLATRRVDLSIQPIGVMQGFASQEIFTEDWVCAVWSDHPEVGKRLTLEQFKALPHASFSFGTEEGNRARRRLGGHGESLKVPFTTGHFAALPLMLRGTRLIAVVQRRLGELLSRSGDIRLLEPPIALQTLRLGMFWSPLLTGDRAHAWLREVIVEAAETLQ